MNRITVALLAAFDAAIAALIGIVIPLVPLTVLWAVQYDTAVDWVLFWRVAADAWLLGNGADLTATLDPALALSLGLTATGTSFLVSIAPLAFALLATLLGVRIGRRAAASPYRVIAVATAVLIYLGIATLVTFSATDAAASIPLWQGMLWPTLVFALGIAIGSGIASAREQDALADAVGALLDRIPAVGRVAADAALRGGALAAAGVVGVAGVLVAVLLIGNYAGVVAMYESLDGGIVGGIALTIGQLAFIPNLVLWAASWLIGPGFAIGTGSSVAPAGTLLGPVPALPVFAALPQGELAFGFVGVLVPLIAGFVAAWAIRPRLMDRLDGASLLLWGSVTAVGIGVVGGALLGLLAWFSGGAAGPGRLAEVGPDGLLVGAIAAAELTVAALLGLASGRSR
ncbi:hypothetical protein HQQ81_20455 [Microbacteriaceae bacterium VKM Ac-2854]|nr:hypothetical protein [Microbacteriaceae bacterium VKM Ac-2854]